VVLAQVRVAIFVNTFMKPTNIAIGVCPLLTAAVALLGCVADDDSDSDEGLETQAASTYSCTATPDGLYARAQGSYSVKLTWSYNADDEKAFLIERSDDEGEWFLLTIIAKDLGSYLDTSYSPGRSYRYRVSAITTCTPAVPSPIATIPKAPTNLHGQLVSGSTFQLGWTDKSTNETAFVVQQRVGSGTWGDAKTVAENATSTRMTLLGGYNHFRVRAKTPTGASWYTNEVSYSY